MSRDDALDPPPPAATVASTSLGRAGRSPGIALARAELRMLGHWIASGRREPKLKVVVVSLAALGLWVGAYRLSRAGFHWLVLFGDEILPGFALRLDDLVMARLLSGFAMALFALLCVSNLLVSFAAYFRARDVPFLLATPMPLGAFFWSRFVKCASFTSWSSLYLGAPVLLAYGIESGAPVGFYLMAGAFAVPFVALPTALGILGCFVTVRLAAGLPRRVVGATAALLLAALVLLFRSLVPDLGEGGLATVLRLATARQSPYVPPTWFASGVLAAGRGDLGEALFHLLLLSANALAAFRIAGAVTERWFWQAWNSLQPSSARRRVRRALHSRHRAHPLLALSLKDLRTFWRDPGQWTQFAILFGVLVLYATNMRRQSTAYDPVFWRGALTLLNSAAGLLVLATLTTRFFFPLLSLEGRRFWLLKLSPLPIRQLVGQKVLLSMAVTAPFSLGLALVSGLRLGLPADHLLLSLGFAALATGSLSGLAVGLGGVYPNFELDNPARIVSGLGGTLTFIASLVYVLLLTVAQGMALEWPTLLAFLPDRWPQRFLTAASLAFAFVWSAIACLWPLRLGARNLERYE